ncbi:hypothetical protein L6452_35695 [Arctium lappa]|uniref:Uncharacterized protein n=1 Tax=Arctium lappa TaxID=4217 RepID=A0ACB8Y7V4_ARCLA|nr:hypothetical protein L6452_35695 [Arctium lappa]
MESELEELKKKMVDWESTMSGQEEHFKEVLRAQREEILKEVRDTFRRTSELSGSSDETTVLKEENARLKRELEALKAPVLRQKVVARCLSTGVGREDDVGVMQHHGNSNFGISMNGQPPF